MGGKSRQLGLFDNTQQRIGLPIDYQPTRPEHLEISRIFLARGSVSTPERHRFVERICSLYPGTETVKCPDTPHNRIILDERETLALHQAGKKTLVFGELKSAVRFSREEGNTCPNYWHFSPYGFCPFGCKYCYLAGTQGVRFSPTVKIYVNLPEMINTINNTACNIGKPTPFYIGKLQDPLALDSLTAYSSILVPFFAEHPQARLILLTKSTNVNRLLDTKHHGNTILSWSVNPPEVCEMYEENVPGIEERLEAMRSVASAGYPVRVVMMPVIPVDGWEEKYTAFTVRLLKEIPVQRLTLGGICIYQGARKLMEHKLGLHNSISDHINNTLRKSGDGRARYSPELRERIYSTIIQAARKICPDLEVALCLEEHQLWSKLGIEKNLGLCNCVL